MVVHSGIKDFEYNKWDKTFTLQRRLKTHMLGHSGIKDFECS